MKIFGLLSKLTFHGRTVTDPDTGGVFFNWTCGGFTVAFSGKTLRARLAVLGDELPAPPGSPPSPTCYPCIGVVADGDDTLLNRQECRENGGWYTLWESEEPREHVLRLIKLSENSRGKLGLLELETDGAILQAPPERKPYIEMVGDSITCGFGNEAANNDTVFRTSEENGWMTYGALAARELGCGFGMVSESGISAIQPEKPMFPIHTMDEIYHLTDELFDRRRGVEAQSFDFKAHPNDVVVINLGTNDCTPIRFCPDFALVDGMEAHFHKKYKDFISYVRRCNGPDTYIACTLGSMDYYLWEHIQAAVEEYRAETGDERICSFKMRPINVMTEGFGAMGHPSLKTNQRMGRELAAQLRKHIPFLAEKEV